MQLSRRSLLVLAASAAALRVPGAHAATTLAEHSVGSATAPVTAIEFFSLTCPHCARFARDTMPEVHSQLIDTGKLRMIYRDFPLDQVALMAAQVAHALPPARYEPFAFALLASQDRWAFARGVNSTEELAKMAALAGLSRPAFDAAIADTALRDAILAEQDDAEKTYKVDSTPTFIFNGPKATNRRESGELSFAAFAKIVSEAGGTAG